MRSTHGRTGGARPRRCVRPTDGLETFPLQRNRRIQIDADWCRLVFSEESGTQLLQLRRARGWVPASFHRRIINVFEGLLKSEVHSVPVRDSEQHMVIEDGEPWAGGRYLAV